MQVSNQSSAHELLARRNEAMDPREMRMRKLFTQRQAEIARMPERPGQAGTVKTAAAVSTTAPAAGTTASAAGLRLGAATTAATAGSPAAPPGQPNAATLPTDVAAELTVEGLMSRWGSSDARYDLDKSGTVDMKDLVMLLSDAGPAGGAGGAGPSKPGAFGGDVDPLGTTDPTVAPSSPPGDGGAPAPAAELTMDGFMKAWGSDDASYDLDGDGTVGMSDLLAMLSAQGVESPLSTTATTAGAGGAGDAPEDPAELTMEGFSAAWGTDDPAYDLDGDGTVGMNDLLAYLATVSPDEAGVAAAGAVPDELADAAEAPVLGTLSATAPGAAKPVKGGDEKAGGAIGGPAPADPAAAALSSTLDAIDGGEPAKKAAPVAGPGGVATTDAVDPSASSGEAPPIDLATAAAMTRTWGLAAGTMGEGTMDLATLAGLGSADVQGATLETPEQAADHVAAQLHERFAAVGFEQSPPSNLHEVLDGLRLADGDRKMVIERLQARYPQGLGLNAVA